MSTSTVTILDSRDANINQSWERTTLLTLSTASGTHRLRVRIRRNTYDFQSHAIIERWDGLRWQQVESIPYSQMKSCGVNGRYQLPIVSYTSNTLSTEAIEVLNEDQNELIRLAKLVLE